MEKEELLKIYVEQSNAIGNIFLKCQYNLLKKQIRTIDFKRERKIITKEHPLFLDHLTISRIVYDQPVAVTPEMINSIILRNIHLEYVGKYRDYSVNIIGHKTPEPSQIKPSLDKLKECLRKDIKKAISLSEEEKEKLSWYYHDWFKSIYPFRDGNGRTARLFMNSIRLNLGLLWLIVLFSKKNTYYEHIDKWRLENKSILSIA